MCSTWGLSTNLYFKALWNHLECVFGEAEGFEAKHQGIIKRVGDPASGPSWCGTNDKMAGDRRIASCSSLQSVMYIHWKLWLYLTGFFLWISGTTGNSSYSDGSWSLVMSDLITICIQVTKTTAWTCFKKILRCQQDVNQKVGFKNPNKTSCICFSPRH